MICAQKNYIVISGFNHIWCWKKSIIHVICFRPLCFFFRKATVNNEFYIWSIRDLNEKEIQVLW